MKPSIRIMLLLVMAISHPASAARVTNMDQVPHTVIYSAAGNVSHLDVPVGETIYIVGVPDGRLSLKTSRPMNAQRDVVTDGLFSDMVGVMRNQNIPVNDEDDLVIWPDEQLMIQRRRRQGRN